MAFNHPKPDGFNPGDNGKDFQITRQLDHRKGSNLATDAEQMMDQDSWARRVHINRSDLANHPEDDC